MCGLDLFFLCPLCFFLYSLLSYLSSVSFLLFHSCCSHALEFGKTLVHEFLISYRVPILVPAFFAIRNTSCLGRRFGCQELMRCPHLLLAVVVFLEGPHLLLAAVVFLEGPHLLLAAVVFLEGPHLLLAPVMFLEGPHLLLVTCSDTMLPGSCWPLLPPVGSRGTVLLTPCSTVAVGLSCPLLATVVLCS